METVYGVKIWHFSTGMKLYLRYDTRPHTWLHRKH